MQKGVDTMISALEDNKSLTELSLGRFVSEGTLKYISIFNSIQMISILLMVILIEIMIYYKRKSNVIYI